MFCEIYAQLKASKILACAVQNPDKCTGRGADRAGKKSQYPFILILLAKRIALDSYVIYTYDFISNSTWKIYLRCLNNQIKI